MSPEQELIAAVLKRGVEDLNVSEFREEAYEWFKSKTCKQYCELINLDYSALLAKVKGIYQDG